jgi:hypothetical protein
MGANSRANGFRQQTEQKRTKLGICLGFVTESNKPFIRFGVTGPILKSTTEVTKKIKNPRTPKKVKKSQKNKKIHEITKKQKNPRKNKKIHEKNKKIHEVTKKIKKIHEKNKKSTNSNFGFHIGYSAAEIRMNFVRRTDRYESSFGYRGRTLDQTQTPFAFAPAQGCSEV